MIRRGSCRRCGRCCSSKHLNQIIGKDPDIPKMLKKILKKVTNNCPSLRGKIGTKTWCVQYADRPSFCKDYPAEPLDLIKGCGYEFVEVSDDYVANENEILMEVDELGRRKT